MAAVEDGSSANLKSAVCQFCVQCTKRQTLKTKNRIENRDFLKTEN